ncbi:MAG TPA: ABC transporter permease [Gemmatimonadaceae bacterium]|jgi:predicted permease|nr:ABC transporter permease [Gemmatimonadaceae bacterium]
MQRRLSRVLDDAAQRVRHVNRSLRRNPAFALATLLTLTIGIGGVVAIFAVVDGILLRPLPYPQPERLVGAWHDMPPVSLYHAQQSVTTYFTYRTQTHTIDGIGIYKEGSANVSVPGQAADPRRLAIANASASLFSVLGTPARAGRPYSEEEDAVGAAPVALISEETWRALFAGDPGVIGRSLDVNGVTRRVVGVMPSSFRVPSAETAIWIPLNVDPASPPGDAFAYTAVARLSRGVAIPDAQRDFAAVLPRVSELYPRFVPGITTRQIMDQARPTPVLTPLIDDITGGVARTVWVVAGAALLLFLVASLNAGNLALVRLEARQRELAVRQMLGAGRARVARDYVSEIVVIAAIAGAFSLLLADVAVHVLVSKGPADIPRIAELTVNGRAAAFATLITAAAVAIASVLPLSRIRRGAIGRSAPTRSATESRDAHRTRRALVAGQVARRALGIRSASAFLSPAARRPARLRRRARDDVLGVASETTLPGRCRDGTVLFGAREPHPGVARGRGRGCHLAAAARESRRQPESGLPGRR